MKRASACTCAPCEITVCPTCGKSRYQTGIIWTKALPTRDGWYAHRIRVPLNGHWSIPEIVFVYPEFLQAHRSGRMEEEWGDRPYVLPHEEEA